MWVSRKEWNELKKQFYVLREEVRELEDEFKVYKKGNFINLKEEIKNLKMPRELCYEQDVELIKKAIVNGTSKEDICKDMGICYKTLRNIVNGEKVKPETKERLHTYVTNLL